MLPRKHCLKNAPMCSRISEPAARVADSKGNCWRVKYVDTQIKVSKSIEDWDDDPILTVKLMRLRIVMAITGAKEGKFITERMRQWDEFLA
jgi:hypothetical protein